MTQKISPLTLKVSGLIFVVDHCEKAIIAFKNIYNTAKQLKEFL